MSTISPNFPPISPPPAAPRCAVCNRKFSKLSYRYSVPGDKTHTLQCCLPCFKLATSQEPLVIKTCDVCHETKPSKIWHENQDDPTTNRCHTCYNLAQRALARRAKEKRTLQPEQPENVLFPPLKRPEASQSPIYNPNSGHPFEEDLYRPPSPHDAPGAAPL